MNTTEEIKKKKNGVRNRITESESKKINKNINNGRMRYASKKKKKDTKIQRNKMLIEKNQQSATNMAKRRMCVAVDTPRVRVCVGVVVFFLFFFFNPK